MQELMTVSFNGLGSMEPADREKLATMLQDVGQTIMVRGPHLGERFTVIISDNGEDYIKVEAQSG